MFNLKPYQFLRKTIFLTHAEVTFFANINIMPVDFVGFGYAIAVAAGGVMGYVKSGK